MGYDAAIAIGPPRCLVDIQGTAAAVATLAARHGLTLPDTPNSWAGSDGTALAWLGERRWMLLAPLADEDTWEAAMTVDQPDVSAVLVSDAYASFRIRGPDADEILAQATPLDVHPAAFPARGATFTEFFGETALLLRGEDGFTCFVDGSLAAYLALCLARCNADDCTLNAGDAGPGSPSVTQTRVKADAG